MITVEALMTFQAAVLLACPCAALVSLWLLRRRRPSVGAFVVGLGLALITAVVGFIAGFHLCYEGGPLTQWAIPAGCVFVSWLATASVRWRWALTLGFAVISIYLSGHFAWVVHASGWTGNPDYDRSEYELESMREQGRGFEANSLDAQWIRDVQLSTTVKIYDVADRRAFGWAWHTWLTGLYPYEPIPQDYWFPGGSFPEDADAIELRDRAVAPGGHS